MRPHIELAWEFVSLAVFAIIGALDWFGRESIVVIEQHLDVVRVVLVVSLTSFVVAVYRKRWQQHQEIRRLSERPTMLLTFDGEGTPCVRRNMIPDTAGGGGHFDSIQYRVALRNQSSKDTIRNARVRLAEISSQVGVEPLDLQVANTGAFTASKNLDPGGVPEHFELISQNRPNEAGQITWQWAMQHGSNQILPPKSAVHHVKLIATGEDVHPAELLLVVEVDSQGQLCVVFDPGEF